MLMFMIQSRIRNKLNEFRHIDLQQHVFQFFLFDYFDIPDISMTFNTSKESVAEAEIGKFTLIFYVRDNIFNVQ